MVAAPRCALVASIFVLADEPQTVLTRLDPPMRAKVLAALAGLIILGFGLVALAWLGARVTRRYMRQGEPKRPPPDENDWARKPLIPPEPRVREREEGEGEG